MVFGRGAADEAANPVRPDQRHSMPGSNSLQRFLRRLLRILEARVV
jgi:hypothetical protein